MTAAEHGEWIKLNELSGSLRAGRPCDDCPIEWAREQGALCNGDWRGLATLDVRKAPGPGGLSLGD